MTALAEGRPDIEAGRVALARTSVSLLASGDYARVERALAHTLRSLTEALPFCGQIQAIYDGSAWSSTPLVQSVHALNPRLSRRVIADSDLPACLFNEALRHSDCDLSVFLWPGCTFPVETYGAIAAPLVDDELLGATVSDVGSLSPYANWMGYGLIQYGPRVSLSGAVLRTQLLREIGGADETPLFQRALDWDVLLRLSRLNAIRHVAVTPPSRTWDLASYPFRRVVSAPQDAVARSCVDTARVGHLRPSNCDPAGSGRSSALESPGRGVPRAPIRVTVTGGVWEHVHNQLCFFNYFETEEGRRRFSWRLLLDADATEEDLDGTEILILSRGKHPNLLRLLEWCESTRTPALYMLDDNWFTVAADWPEDYGALFGPSSETQRVFTGLLRRCDAAVLYSRLLEDHVRPLAKRVFRLRLNVNVRHFGGSAERPQEEPSPLRVGYSGSLRYTRTAFDGLKAFLRKRPNTDLLWMGSPPAFVAEGLPSHRIHVAPYVLNYPLYAKTIGNFRPDILLAPLDNSLTSASKCPNKFLEISACRATGVYSWVAPYSEPVVDGWNGRLMPLSDCERPEAWTRILDDLYCDRKTQRRLADNAHREVAADFSPEAGFPGFEAMVRSLVGR